MKLIEAMKRVKANKEKIADLQERIGQVAAHLSIESPLYGVDTPSKINEWIQSCNDLTQENVRLLVAVARTNLATAVPIQLGGKLVTKSIAEWVWRRREYAAVDLATWSKLNDRGLNDRQLSTSTGVPLEIKVVRNYDPDRRDEKISEFKMEPHEIDAALEVVNAVTDLVD